MLNVVTFMWKPRDGYRSKYGPEHVFAMEEMIRRNYHGGTWGFHVVSDFPREAFDNPRSMLHYHPLWTDYADVQHPHGEHNPSCYRRLRLYSDWARETIGGRIIQLDLDMVLVGDVTPLWTRPEPFVFWQDQLNRHGRINGAMQLITPGLRDDIWSGFCAKTARVVGRQEGKWGSDQGWLAHNFAEGTYGTWGTKEGAYSWRVHCQPNGGQLPEGARIVNFHGHTDPWTHIDTVPWIRQHYPLNEALT